MDNFGDYKILNVPFGSAYFGKNGWTENGEWPTFFSKDNSVPHGNRGNPVSRDLLNKVGYLATIGAYLDRIGYPYGNKPPFTPVAGVDTGATGYPKGAIVSVWDENAKAVREYISLQDNNTNNYPWSPSVQGTADSDTEHSTDGSASFPTGGNDYWKPLFKMDQFDFFPDYSNRTVLVNEDVNSGSKLIECSVPNSGWIVVTRTIQRWEELSENLRIGRNSTPPETSINSQRDYNYPFMRMVVQEGMTATRFFPFGMGSFWIRASNYDGARTSGEPYGPMNVKVELLGFEAD